MSLDVAQHASHELFGVLRELIAPPNVFVHLSALLGLSGFISSNVLMLRAFSIMSSLSALAFNTWNGLKIPAVWNVVFTTINSLRITQLLRSQKGCLTLTQDEQKLYERAFLKFGVTPSEFASLLHESGASWHHARPGEWLAEQGDEMPKIWYIISGSVDIIRNGRPVRQLNPCRDIEKAGGWIGELWDPNAQPDYWEKEHHWHVGFRVRDSGATVVSFARKPLHDAIARRPTLREAATKAEVADLWGKLRASMRAIPVHYYRGMRKMAENDGVMSDEESSALELYMQQHPDVLDEQSVQGEPVPAPSSPQQEQPPPADDASVVGGGTNDSRHTGGFGGWGEGY